MVVLSHSSLLWQFVKRDILQRYRGSLLGMGWAVLTPLVTLLIYTFVFREVFQVRWHGGAQLGGVEFALRIYLGLLAFGYFSECFARAPRLVIEQTNLVKKVVFPLQLLAWVPALSAIVPLAAGGVILFGALVSIGQANIHFLYLPIIWLPLLPLALACGWLLSALSVYARDIAQIIAPLTTLLMFLTPVFYPLEAFPERWRGLLMLNPLTPVIEESRRVVLLGQTPDFSLLLVVGVCSVLVAALASFGFRLLRRGFADVL